MECSEYTGHIRRFLKHYEYRTIGRNKERKDVQDIPIEEISNAFCHILYNQLSLSGDDVVRETGRELGFARIGANVSDSINWAVKYSVNQGKVKKTDDGGYSLTEEYGEKLRKFIVKS